MWKFVCLWLSFAVLLANAQKNTLEKSSSASDEIEDEFTTRHGTRLQFLQGESKAEECLEMGQIWSKVCDPDNLLNGPEKELIKVALRELETVTIQPMHPDQFQQGGIKLAVLLMQNIKDTKKVDEKIFEIVKAHAEMKPYERVGVILLSVGSDFSNLQRQKMIHSSLNIPVYHYTAGVWSNFYSTATLNNVVSPSEIVQLYTNESPLLRVGTFGVALLDIINGIRNKALIKQGQKYAELSLNQVRQSLNFRQQPQQTLEFGMRMPREMQTMNDEVYKVERCLEQFDTKVCDPDDLLTAEEQIRIDTALMNLESETVEFGHQQQINSRLTGSSCKQGGIKLTTVIIKEVQDQQNVDRKINEMLYKRSVTHPCERTAVMMLSPGPDYRDRKFQQGIQQPLFLGSSGLPMAVWSKFYGISNINVPVSSFEIVQLYDMQKPLIRMGKYADALINIIRDFKNRVLSGRVVRQTEDFDRFGSLLQNERIGKKTYNRKLNEEDKQKIFQKLVDCLKNIESKVCDLGQMLTDNERLTIEESLDVLEKDTIHSTEFSKQKGFVLTVVLMPYTEDISMFENKITEQLVRWRSEHPMEHVGIIMLCADDEEGGQYNRSKFYGTSTRGSPVRPHEFVQIYNNNKYLIRMGKHDEALLNIVNKIHERAMRRQQGGNF